MSVVAVLGTITQSRVNATASERRPSIVKSSINWSVVDELTAFSKVSLGLATALQNVVVFAKICFIWGEWGWLQKMPARAISSNGK